MNDKLKKMTSSSTLNLKSKIGTKLMIYFISDLLNELALNYPLKSLDSLSTFILYAKCICNYFIYE
ncbi:hypothetical protein HGQ85_18940 [Clostridioides difficile]|nr:hypothetical protein [Clostridioides difficile]